MLKAPLRVAILCSHRAPGLGQIIEDFRHGRLYELVCCLTSEDGFAGQSEAQDAGIPCLRHPIRRFYASRQVRLADFSARVEYDQETVALLAPFSPDLVVLSSYLFILTPAMLGAYPGRIVNVHHSDLTILDALGRPRYAGLRAVRDAIFAGEPETRATAHLVTEELDAGPVLLRSWSFPVAPAELPPSWDVREVLKAYVFAHQECMLRNAWGPLMAGAIDLLATRTVKTLGRTAWIDGSPGPWDLLADGSIRRPHHVEAAVWAS